MLTIITPTYNRAHTLEACYSSLKSQTDNNFTWMIVDDGSSDETETLVNDWIKEQNIKIVYLKKENGGKASALNLGVQNMDTPYACCLDSDDIFYPDTVEKALRQLDEIKSDESCCGLMALRNNPDGSVMGNKEIPKTYEYIKAEDIYLKLKLRTELICFYKTEIWKHHYFPVFDGEKFVSPTWLDYELSRYYRFKTSWDKLCKCEYIADGLTKNKRKVIVKNPKGYTCVKRQHFEFAKSLKMIVKHGIMYDCGCIISNDKDWLKNAPKKGWAILLRPFARLVYFNRFYKIIKKR